MVSRLQNIKFLNYNNGPMLGVGGERAEGPTKLYTHLLRFVKNTVCIDSVAGLIRHDNHHRKYY